MNSSLGWTTIACLTILGRGAREMAPSVRPVVVPAEEIRAAPAPEFVTLAADCSFVGLPARRGRVLLVPSGGFGTPSVFRFDLDTQQRPLFRTDSMDESELDIEACCDEGDASACERFSLEVEETLVDITTIDVVPHRDRSVHVDDLAMGEGPFLAYCECGDESRTRATSAPACGHCADTASYMHVYAEFVVSGRRYRVLVDHQWDVFSMVPPRVEGLAGETWAHVTPHSETNSRDADCPRHHFSASFGVYWSESAKLLLIAYGMEGPSQSHCEPGIHYVAYML